MGDSLAGVSGNTLHRPVVENDHFFGKPKRRQLALELTTQPRLQALPVACTNGVVDANGSPVPVWLTGCASSPTGSLTVGQVSKYNCASLVQLRPVCGWDRKEFDSV